MRGVLVLGVLLWAQAVGAQAPASPTPAPKPAAPAARRPAAAPARSGMAVTVTDALGTTLPGVRVEILGASDRSGDTDASGQINFTRMQAGTYRVRFSGETVVGFEKEVTLKADRSPPWTSP